MVSSMGETFLLGSGLRWDEMVFGEEGCFEKKTMPLGKDVLKKNYVIPPKCVFIRNIFFLWGKVHCVSLGRYGNK